MNTRLFTFSGGEAGAWRVVRMETIAGDPLPSAAKLDIFPGSISQQSHGAKWLLRGITSNDRYVTHDEKNQLVAKQPGLGRPEATCAALIPIRKNASWWSLSQDERRMIFEEQSKHIHIGLQYLPAIARRLHHCRDLGESEPFSGVPAAESSIALRIGLLDKRLNDSENILTIPHVFLSRGRAVMALT